MSAAATIRKGRRPCRTGSRAWRCARLMSPGQLLEHVVDRDAARPEQDDRVEPQVGGLLHDAAVALATERGRDDLGRLLADLAGDRRLAAREQPGHVRPGGAPVFRLATIRSRRSIIVAPRGPALIVVAKHVRLARWQAP